MLNLHPFCPTSVDTKQLYYDNTYLTVTSLTGQYIENGKSFNAEDDLPVDLQVKINGDNWKSSSREGGYRTVQLVKQVGDKFAQDSVRFQLLSLKVLAYRHRPQLWLHGSEYCGPIDATHMVVNGKLGLGANPPHDDASFKLMKSGMYRQRYAYLTYKSAGLRKSDENVTRNVYYHGLMGDPETDQGAAYIQYWMFYPSSTPPTDRADDEEVDVWHEGDWEMFQIKFDTCTGKPVGGTVGLHYEGRTREWEEIETLDNKGVTPVVYVAAGSHANYFTEGEHLYTGAGWPQLDHTQQGRTWGGYRLRSIEEVKAGQFLYVLEWPGYWGAFMGAVEDLGRSGPRGPQWRPFFGRDGQPVYQPDGAKRFHDEYQ